MKTQTTNPTNIGENTNTRNFFQKTFILLAILAFTSFGFKAKAQQAHLTVNNNLGSPSGCDWRVYFYDASSTLLYTSILVTSGNILYAGCVSWVGAAVDQVVVVFQQPHYLLHALVLVA